DYYCQSSHSRVNHPFF
nr:immunoglobulin light chain junction region [Macaca mulatta]MOV66775.1 immunoglobulin light chain junction region [Macaca mulatta]MOV66959.1 immunoglobulin light chain junction region [Macaca mulatta]MOV67866.1 immunoglobulin light chain junction region [Macaca mulatta]MOV67987.1 immunoglobulin light chain junction region [Macaca mulatta]